MHLSVIVPVWCEADTLPSTLPPLAAQLRPGDELLLVDAHSPDTTPDVVHQLALPHTSLTHSPTRGRAAQLAHGLAHTRNPGVVLLHADSRLAPNALDLARRHLRTGAHWGFFWVQLHHPAWRYRWVELGINLRSRTFHTPSGDMGLFALRHTLHTVGGIPQVPLMEDLVLADRLRTHAPATPARGVILTSARRWETHGAARTVLHMWALRLAYRLGVPLPWLRNLYPPHRHG